MSTQNLKGIRLDTAEIVAYQDGTIVSKTLIDKKSATITVFAFDKGQGLSEHTAPFDALVNVLDGATEITIGGTIHSLKKGDSIIMPANISHALKATEKFKMMLVMVRE